MLDVTKNILLTFKGNCMNFSLELLFFILSHPVTSKQPHKIVQILLGHPVRCRYNSVPLHNTLFLILGFMPMISGAPLQVYYALTRTYLKQKFTGNQAKMDAHRASVQPKAVLCFWSDTEPPKVRYFLELTV